MRLTCSISLLSVARACESGGSWFLTMKLSRMSFTLGEKPIWEPSKSARSAADGESVLTERFGCIRVDRPNSPIVEPAFIQDGDYGLLDLGWRDTDQPFVLSTCDPANTEIAQA